MEPMIKKAYVEEVNGDTVVLKIKRECACQNKYSCVKKCFTLQDEIITVTVKMENDIGVKAGDFVEVEGNSSSILRYAAVAFLLPIFISLSAYFISLRLTSNEIISYVIAGASFGGSIVFLYYFLNKTAKNRNDFTIGKILP